MSASSPWAREDVAQVVGDGVRLVREQLPLGFEITELEGQMDRNGGGVRLDRGAFWSAQGKIVMAIGLGEVR